MATGTIISVTAILPILVFIAETCVVTLSTVRTIFIARGWKHLAPLLGFFEVSIWLFAIGQVMQNLTRPTCFIAFAGGFSLGNFLGVLIEKKLALGKVVLQLTTSRDPGTLLDRLRLAGYGVTTLDAQGATGPVKVIFTVIRRKELDRVVATIEEFDSRAFYAINDLQSAAKGVFPAAQRPTRTVLSPPLLQAFRIVANQGPEITVDSTKSTFNPDSIDWESLRASAGRTGPVDNQVDMTESQAA